jgi:hypothetical protein
VPKLCSAVQSQLVAPSAPHRTSAIAAAGREVGEFVVKHAAIIALSGFQGGGRRLRGPDRASAGWLIVQRPSDEFPRPTCHTMTKFFDLLRRQAMTFECLVWKTVNSQQGLGQHAFL